MSAVSARSPRSTLVLCAAAAPLEGFDNQSMGVAAPRLVPEFALSASQAGLMFSAATFGLFLGAAIGGRVADRVGRKWMLIVSMLLFGLCSLATAVATGPGFLFVVRLLTGLGLGGAMPNFITLATESVPPQRRLSAGTLVMAALPCGGALAGLLSVMDFWGGGWRAIFYFGGVLPILLAALMARALSESPSFQRERDRAFAVAGGGPRPVEHVATVLFGPGRTLTTLLLWGSFFFTQLVLLLMLNWLPSLLVGLGFSRAQGGWASVCFNLCGASGAVLLASLHGKEGRRAWVIATYASMAVALTGVAAVEKSIAAALIACGLAGAFIIGAQLILFALAPLYYRSAVRGTGVGAAVCVGRLGSVFGPLYAAAVLAGGGGSGTVLFSIEPFVAIAGCAALALTWRAQCIE